MGRYNQGMSKLTHLDEHGNAKMVDVSHKPDTERIAIARGEIHMKKETLDLIRAGQIKKGDVLTVAQIAGREPTQHASHLSAPHAAAEGKLHLFREFDPLAAESGDLEVPDPYYGGEDGFDEVVAMVRSAVPGIRARVQEFPESDDR